MINYTDEFTKAMFKYCRGDTIKRIDSHMAKNEYNSIRIALENDLDDHLLYKNGKIINEKKEIYRGRNIAYSLFMSEYIKTLDKNKYDSNNRRRQSSLFEFTEEG